MIVARTRRELDTALAGRPGRRGVVMTMGALHDGHLALVRAAHEHAQVVVATIFVNPLQFGPTEDLDRYPRDLDGDVAALDRAGVDVVFAPEVEEVYPREPLVTVSAGPIGEVLEGAHRPGHLDGVLTVVLKLMHLVAPDVALFGQKDAQQVVAVRRMVADLDVDVEVVAVPTVREADGLALSSRNAYLDPAGRRAALALSGALSAGERTAASGGGAGQVRDAAERVLAAQPGLRVDYLALTDPELATVDEQYRGPALLLVAGRVGATRLIDNAVLELTGTPRTEER
jgi:pantoate--beta-alanine ligase